jgi:tetratricopeptide (TPR) repeat protein
MRRIDTMFSRGITARLFVRTLLAWAVIAVIPLHASLERAQELYQQTQYREALRDLEAIAQKTGPVYSLMGKTFYQMGDFSKAADALEKAVGAEPRNAVYWNWLGKAYGRRAETSFVLNQPRYAVRAREHFERAVMLDPQNREALSDLFEYYLEAPGFLGGGLDKAAELSERLKSLDPARYHSMQARLAEKHKDLAQAERFLRQAVDTAPTQPGRLADLARFLARQQRFAESDAVFEQAARIAPDNADLKFTRARTYLDSKRNRALARQLLEDYLKAPLTPDDPPRADAERLLRSIPRS